MTPSTRPVWLIGVKRFLISNSSIVNNTLSIGVSIKFESVTHKINPESRGSDAVYDRATSFIYLSISNVIIGGLIS